MPPAVTRLVLPQARLFPGKAERGAPGGGCRGTEGGISRRKGARRVKYRDWRSTGRRLSPRSEEKTERLTVQGAQACGMRRSAPRVLEQGRSVRPRPETAEGQLQVTSPGRLPPPVPPHRVSPPVHQSLPVRPLSPGPHPEPGALTALTSGSQGNGNQGSERHRPRPRGRGAARRCESATVAKRTVPPTCLAPLLPPRTPGSAPRGAWRLRVLTLPTPEHTQPSAAQVHACAHAPCTRTMHTHTRAHTCKHTAHIWIHHTRAHMRAHADTCTYHSHTYTHRHRRARVRADTAPRY